MCIRDRNKKREVLFNILEGISQNNEQFSYYQGYHDIASIVMLIFGLNKGYHISNQLAHTFFKDPLEIEFERSVIIQISLISMIVEKEDQQLGSILKQCEMYSFCVSWLLTWFSHTIADLNIIFRIFDFLICCQPYFIIYLCASFILKTKDKLIEQIKEESEDGQLGVIFTFYQNIKVNQTELEQILSYTLSLEKKISFYDIQKKFYEQKHSQLPPESALYDNIINQKLPYRNQIKEFRKNQYNDFNQKSGNKRKFILSNTQIKFISIGVLVASFIAYSIPKYLMPNSTQI
eukprot:TRINITY_DN17815_c0_g2_i1.p1 TRINITY_DN17815_c0_g2~~TRINITY_DN17815_c0_g2_i1.p1  ORF type:complete len:291 (-),score=37.75 TRINITY_DN17815_c0_g2_i1:192-1064(-)